MIRVNTLIHFIIQQVNLTKKININLYITSHINLVFNVNKQFIVMVVEYDEKSENKIKTLSESFINSLVSENSKGKIVYDGSEEKYVTALESILNLAEKT